MIDIGNAVAPRIVADPTPIRTELRHAVAQPVFHRHIEDDHISVLGTDAGNQRVELRDLFIERIPVRAGEISCQMTEFTPVPRIGTPAFACPAEYRVIKRNTSSV